MMQLSRRKRDLITDEGWAIAEDDPAVPIMNEFIPRYIERERQRIEEYERRRAKRRDQERRQQEWSPPFAQAIRRLYPRCPEAVVEEVSRRKGYHTITDDSVRKSIEDYVRHNLTDYEEHLSEGAPTNSELLRWESIPSWKRQAISPTFRYREQARDAVRPSVEEILREWG